MASVRLDNIHKTYPNGHVAARGLSLEIEDGELLVFVGPSGCGKSTALRIVAGLETPTSGTVWIDDCDCTEVPPQKRDIAMVFQSYALYPHKTIRDNLAFGLRMRGHDRAEIEQRVERAAGALGLVEFLDRKPGQLSGGQRQRVALGRAIVREPKAFLFDEPLSNLDAKLRVNTRAELARMHRRLGATMIYVTHDQEEAMTLGTRVAVMNEGVFQQVAPPMEVYNRPANAFVAGFVGSPAMNFFMCDIREEPEGVRLISGSLTVRLEGTDWSAHSPASITLGVRPHAISLVPVSGADVKARIDVIEPLGSEILVHVRLEGAAEEVRVVLPPEVGVEPEQIVGLKLDQARLHIFDGASGNRLN